MSRCGRRFTLIVAFSVDQTWIATENNNCWRKYSLTSINQKPYLNVEDKVRSSAFNASMNLTTKIQVAGVNREIHFALILQHLPLVEGSGSHCSKAWQCLFSRVDFIICSNVCSLWLKGLNSSYVEVRKTGYWSGHKARLAHNRPVRDGSRSVAKWSSWRRLFKLSRLLRHSQGVTSIFVLYWI